MGYTKRLSERLAIVSCIDPDAYAAGAVNGDIIDMSKLSRVMFIIQVGDMVTNSTVDWLLKGSAASNMASSANITGKAITQLTEAGTDSNKQVIVEVTAEEVAAQGFRYIQETFTVATAASDSGTIALGEVDYAPASDYDLASVDEILA